jgi:hypothetical protein
MVALHGFDLGIPLAGVSERMPRDFFKIVSPFLHSYDLGSQAADFLVFLHKRAGNIRDLPCHRVRRVDLPPSIKRAFSNAQFPGQLSDPSVAFSRQLHSLALEHLVVPPPASHSRDRICSFFHVPLVGPISTDFGAVWSLPAASLLAPVLGSDQTS